MRAKLFSSAIAALIAAATLVAAASPLWAFEFAVSPMRVEIPLADRPVTRSLQVVNRSNRQMSLAVRVANFDLDDENKVREIPPTANSLDQWIIIRPLKFTVEAGQTRTIRFAVRPFTRPRTGEHRAMIFITRDTDSKTEKGQFDIGFRFGVAVYAHVGDVRRQAVLHTARATDRAVELDITSTGTASARFSGTYGIWPKTAFPGSAKAASALDLDKFRSTKDYSPPGSLVASMVPDLPILPKTRRVIAAPYAKPLPPGEYTVFVAGMLGETRVRQHLPLTITKK
jgi:hypothetical protein